MNAYFNVDHLDLYYHNAWPMVELQVGQVVFLLLDNFDAQFHLFAIISVNFSDEKKEDN